MRIDVFQEFSLKTMLFDYDTFQFRRMFRGAGGFSLIVHDLSEREVLQEDAILVARQDAWLIEGVHSYQNVRGEVTLEVTGRHINAILERRIVESFTVNTADTIEAQLRQLVTDHFIHPVIAERRVEQLRLGAMKGIAKQATVGYTLEKMTVLEILNRVCGNSRLGYRVDYVPEQGYFAFNILEGRNLAEQVFFSETYGNVAEAEITRESEGYRNAGLKNGSWQGDAAGLYRRETFLEEEESLSDYAKLISVDGMVLDTEQFVYLTDWDLGDIVTYLDGTLGFLVENPVLEIQETYADELDLEVIFGERIPNLF